MDWISHISLFVYAPHVLGSLSINSVMYNLCNLLYNRLITATRSTYEFLVYLAVILHSHIDSFHADLSRAYAVKNLGPAKSFIALDIHRPTATGPILLSQSTYARKVLHRFGMQDCNPAKASFIDTTQPHKRLEDEETADETLYRQIVGSLGYLLTFTRPNLSCAVSKLSQYLSNPFVIHM